MTLADSLRAALATADSLIRVASARPVATSPSPQRAPLSPTRDWFDVLNLVMVIVAAIVSAVISAVLTQRASLAAQREAHEQDRHDAKARLKHVTGTLLDKIASAAIALGSNDGSRPINVSALADIEAALARFEWVSDGLYLLKDAAYGEALEALLARVRTMIGMARAAEGDIEAQLQRLNPTPYVNS